MAQVLSRKFQRETGVGLSDDNLKFIGSLIPRNHESVEGNHEIISWDQFSKIKLQNRDFTFWEWFHAIMVLTRDHLLELWRDRLIIGFISSEKSQEILSQCFDGNFLLRFSESLLGSITINYKQNGQFVKLSPSNANDLKILSLPNRIRNFKSIEYLFPNIPKDQAFGKYYATVGQTQKSCNFVPYTLTDLQLIAKIQNEENLSASQSYQNRIS